jgi:hypothetical protein
MKLRLQSAARALRDFLRGFTGIARAPSDGHRHDDGSRRPFCC